MASLIDVSSYLPPTVPITQLREPLGLDDQQVRRFGRLYGLDRICQAADQSETDLLVAAAAKLETLQGREERVRYVVRAKGLGTTAPYPTSPVRAAAETLGLTRASVFAVADHGCATGLLALDVAAMLLEGDGDPDGLVLILSGDKTFTPFTQWVADVTIMGEGVAAALVGPDGGRDRILGYASRIHGRTDAVVDMTPEVTRHARQIYQSALAEVVAAAVDAAGISIPDIALVLPHNVNRVSWTVAADNLGIPKERLFLDNIARTGHCFCADPFINYERIRQLGLLRPGDHYLMTSAGLGQTFAAMVLQH